MEGFTRDFTKEQSGLDSNPQRGSLVPEFLNHWEMEAGKPPACPGKLQAQRNVTVSFFPT